MPCRTRFSAARCDTGSLTQKVILMMSSTLPPAASTSWLMWAKTLASCSSRLAGNSRVPGLVPPITLDITTLPTRLALGIGFSWRALLPLMLFRFATSRYSAAVEVAPNTGRSAVRSTSASAPSVGTATTKFSAASISRSQISRGRSYSNSTP